MVKSFHKAHIIYKTEGACVSKQYYTIAAAAKQIRTIKNKTEILETQQAKTIQCSRSRDSEIHIEGLRDRHDMYLQKAGQ